MPKFVQVLIRFLGDSCIDVSLLCSVVYLLEVLLLYVCGRGLLSIKAILLIKKQDLESKANWGYIIRAPTPSCSVHFCPRLVYKCTCPCTLSTVLPNYFLLPISTNFYLMVGVCFSLLTFLFNLVALGIVGLVENSEQLTF